MRRCKDCQRYDALCSNAKKVRRDGSSHTVGFTREDFLAWCRERPRRCVYCELPDELIYDLDLRTQVGHRLETLGIDRLDNTRSYELDNIAFCCFPCNKVKGNVFTSEEMLSGIGAAVGAVWRARSASRSAA